MFHNKTPKVFCLTFGVHVKSELPSLSESRKKESWEICLVQNVSPDGPLNGTFTVIPTRKKQSGGHPATRLLCSQAPPLPLGCSFWSLRGAIQAVFAPGEQSLGPPRGNFGLFCPWRAVFGATAGQIGPFLPLGGSLWRHCGAIWAFFAPGVQSLGPLRGNLGYFCPWGAVFGATAGQIGAFLPLGGSLWRHCGAIWAVFAPGIQSLEPPRGNLGRFCPWGTVFGASAGRFGAFLPLGRRIQKNPPGIFVSEGAANPCFKS